MKSSLRVLAWLISIPLGLVVGIMLLSLIASVIPSNAKRSLPREMFDVREFRSSYGFDSDYGLTATGQLSAEQFWDYAEILGFTRDDQVSTSPPRIGWQTYNDPAWNPPDYPQYFVVRKPDIDSFRLLAYDDDKVCYQIGRDPGAVLFFTDGEVVEVSVWRK
jgi:hypothetical protein